MPHPSLVKSGTKTGRFKRTASCLADGLLKTLFCLLCLFFFGIILHKLTHKYERLSVAADKIEDTRLSDLFFAYMNEQTVMDTNIIIINCRNDDRKHIAWKADRACKAGAKAVGFDIEFSLPADSLDDIQLAEVINSNSKIVMADVGSKADAEKPRLAFYNRLSASVQYGSLPQENRLEIKRYFKPFEEGRRNHELPFAMAVAKAAGYTYPGLISRHPEKDPEDCEVIKFKQTISGMPRYRVYYDIPPDSEMSGKIVLLGGYDTSSIDDKHFTPLNGILGRSLPDMYGVEYQAHIISMLIADSGTGSSNEYVDEASVATRYLLVTIVLFFCILLFNYIHHKFKHTGHFLNEIITVALIGPVLFYVFGYMFKRWHYLLEPNYFIIPIFFSIMFLSLYESRFGRKYESLLRRMGQIFKTKSKFPKPKT